MIIFDASKKNVRNSGKNRFISRERSLKAARLLASGAVVPDRYSLYTISIFISNYQRLYCQHYPFSIPNMTSIHSSFLSTKSFFRIGSGGRIQMGVDIAHSSR